ncbi:Ig-like domain-containing protein, partial [Candidatus Uhrbacteria bacterium]|nr:Ig-like domain-containing protein [Candidatus Uhrbacteria bacterium]
MRRNRYPAIVPHLGVLLLCVALPLAALGQFATEMIPTRAPHGARVVVVGSGLDAPTLSVSFTAANGFVVAPIVARTAALIEVNVPSSAVSGAVRVNLGSSTIATFDFTLGATPSFVRVTTLATSDKAHDVFKEPSGNFVFVSSGATYVADRKHHQIKLVRADGSVVVVAGSGKSGFVDGPALEARFAEPRAVAVDAARNVLYIADTQNHVIRAMSLDGSLVATIAGSGRPEDRDGTGAQAGFKQPSGLAIDAAGNLYVADTGNDKIKKMTPDGQVTTVAGAGRPGLGDGPALSALFKGPSGIAVNAAGGVYIADTQNHMIRKFENGSVTTIAGTGHGGFVDGAAAIAEFKEPAALAFDENGDLLVADAKNHVIRKVGIASGNAAVTTIAGSGKPGFTDGDPDAALFHEPSAIDVQGAVYVADTKNDAIRLLLQAVAVTDIYPRSGDPAGGVTVRIFGTGFVPGQTTVRFGMTLATSVTYVASTEILATVPPGAIGPVDVVVTTPAGTATLDDGYLYRQPFTSIHVMPLAPSVDVGFAVPLSAFGVTVENEEIDITEQATWTTAIPTVAVVDANGVARGLSIGTTTVTATYGGLSSSVIITVVGYVRLDVSPASVGLAPGESANLTARATKSNGAVDDVTVQATWTSSDPDVATVAAGHVTVAADGSA